MQKLLILSVLLIGTFIGTFFGWTELGSVQATLNQSGPVQSGSVQCITAPCNYPTSQTTTNQSGPVQSGSVQCITAPCNYQSPPPLSSSPNLDGNDDTITVPKGEIETPDESQNTNGDDNNGDEDIETNEENGDESEDSEDNSNN